jgi:tRNA nucleotidyltransferase (CCA-adding enzyme)
MILNEASPPSSIKRMYELGVLKTIHPDIIIDKDRMKTLNEVNRILNSLHNIIKYKNISKWLIYFLTITGNLTPEEVIKTAKKLKFTSEIIQKITFQKNREINLGLPMKIFPSEIYKELSDMSIEFIIYLMAQTRNMCVRERIINYLTRWKYVKPCVNGDDIIKMGYKPGPYFKEILIQARDATLDGKVSNREESLEYIKQLLDVRNEVNKMVKDGNG